MLLAHQQTALTFINTQDERTQWITLQIAMGLGKTRIGLGVEPDLYLCPATTQLQVEQEQITMNNTSCLVLSYQKARKQPFAGRVVVLDECPIRISGTFAKKLQQARRIIAMTGNFKLPQPQFCTPVLFTYMDRALLPTITHQTCAVYLTPEEQTAYRDELAQCKARLHHDLPVHKQYTQLCRALALTQFKRQAVQHFTQTVPDGLVFFSQYKEHLATCHQALGGSLITVAQSVQVRQDRMQRFQCPVWCDTAAVGTGWNLPQAQTLVFLEPPKNKSQLFQVIGRVRRINSHHRTVLVVILVCQESLEQALHSSNTVIMDR